MLDSPASYRIVNLQQKIDFQYLFDVVCSFEVLEHIREDCLDELIGTIRTNMGRESLFIGTAAFTEEYDVHITVYRREWWLERFSRFGLSPVPDEDKWMELLFRSSPHNWSRSTSSVFVLKRNDL
jgi:cyclopropane fatty-acyl-phospholipid synthase-like methyltransferase